MKWPLTTLHRTVGDEYPVACFPLSVEEPREEEVYFPLSHIQAELRMQRSLLEKWSNGHYGPEYQAQIKALDALEERLTQQAEGK